MVLELLAGGATYKEVEEATGFNFQQIAVIKSRNGQALDVRRKQLSEEGFELAEKMRALAHKRAEMLYEDEDQLKKVPLKDLVLPWAVAQDKAIQAAEGNKVVIEHRKGPSIEDAKAYLDQLRKAAEEGSITV